mgnify:CR=1 FL=1
MTGPLKIISGGQTGVDRAALDVAIELGIAHGGWCPKGRRAEDGRIPDRYKLTEHTDPGYSLRTESNVLCSDATLVVARLGRYTPGTGLTQRMCRVHNRPRMTIYLDEDGSASRVELAGARQYVSGIETLNVAGPRASSAPGIYEHARAFLLEVLG